MPRQIACCATPGALLQPVSQGPRKVVLEVVGDGVGFCRTALGTWGNHDKQSRQTRYNGLTLSDANLVRNPEVCLLQVSRPEPSADTHAKAIPSSIFHGDGDSRRASAVHIDYISQTGSLHFGPKSV